MNEGHLAYLASPEWAQTLRTDLLPWLLDGAELGDDVLEIGPGPGLTTDLLRERAERVTALELDAALAEALTSRLAGTNVEVVQGDGASSGFDADRFSTVTCFYVLHHVPDAATQDALLAEVCRVLRPGGVFVGADALENDTNEAAHLDAGEIWTPMPPSTLVERLRGAGFRDAVVEAGEWQIQFRAWKD